MFVPLAMGEDSIILPIDRVISEDVEGTRYKVEKRGYKLIRHNKRKLSCSTPVNLRRLVIEEIIHGFRSHGVTLASLISCVLILSGCYLMSHSGRDPASEQLRMLGDRAVWSQRVDVREDGENVQFHEDDLQTIRSSIVEGLGLKRMPDPSKVFLTQCCCPTFILYRMGKGPRRHIFHGMRKI